MRTITKISKRTEQKLFCHSEGCCPKNLVTTEPVILSTAKNLSSDPSRSLRTTSLSSRFIKASQTGSIMLEVVAVLALMGVMGSMLFRQIYQRNQELHNIQMASEIRTVKEAFSAYIQANRAALLSGCMTPTCDAHGCDVQQCTNFSYGAVAGYLPDGWFSSAEALSDAYHLTLWNYLQDDGSNRRVIYGIVVPRAGTLPSTGWNFRRAARVALLVGADGGAYDSTITGVDISGSLGSWQIDKEDVIQDGNDCPDVEGCPTYVAMTGIDIFAPEYEAPEGSVNLPDPWNLALNNLHAYNYFSVGNAKGGTGCYMIHHNTSSGTPLFVNPDDVDTALAPDCQPLFWVGDETGGVAPNNGNVYVATDLNIGQIGTDNKHDSALKLTAEGVIKQRNGLTIDKDGRIISSDTVNANIGDLVEGEHYMLDPGHTSTMMDIRLASRGGVRLSDILPNYILKNQTNINCDISSGQPSCSANVPKPTDCPAEYKIGLVVIPTVFGKNSVANTTTNTTGTISSTGSRHSHTHNLSLNGTTIGGEITESGEHSHTVSNGNLTTTLTQRQFQVKINNLGDVPAKENKPTSAQNWSVSFGYDSNVDTEETVYATVQTYCVWEPSLYNGNQNACFAAGYKCTGDNCATCGGRDVGENLIGDKVTVPELGQNRCLASGFTWEGGRCLYKYMAADQINTKISNSLFAGSYSYTQRDWADDVLLLKASACKAAGYKWKHCSSTAGCCYETRECSCS